MNLKKPENNDYPVSFLKNDLLAVTSKNRYVRLTWAILSLMLMATVMDAVSKKITEPLGEYDRISGFILLASLIGTLTVQCLKPEKTWYMARAAAESIKSLSWCYMMQSDPFPASMPDVDNVFIGRCSKVDSDAKLELASADISVGSNTANVTNHMKAVRDASLDDRCQYYLENRVGEQIAWYNRKSATFAGSSRNNTIIIASCQVVAAIYLVFISRHFDAFNINSLMVFAATSIMSLQEMNKYKELIQTYRFTAGQLAILREKFEGLQVKDKQDLNQLVESCEQAMSREHSIWLLRRGEQ